MASVGYSASLLLQDRLLAVTPQDTHGHALGLHTSGMLTMQAVGAALGAALGGALGGALAQWLPPADVMTLLAAASVLVTLALTPGLGHHRSPLVST